MKNPDLLVKEYMYITEVSNSQEDFYVELYPYRPDWQYSDSPIKVLHNFDELIDFLEDI